MNETDKTAFDINFFFCCAVPEEVSLTTLNMVPVFSEETFKSIVEDGILGLIINFSNCKYSFSVSYTGDYLASF